MNNDPPNPSKKAVWTGRVVTVLVSLLFLMSGAMKLIAHPKVVEGMKHLELPASLIRPLGVLEVLCVLIYLIPATSVLGAVLLTAGAAGKRHALPNARIMIHQPLAGMQGTAEEIMIHAKEFKRIKQKMNEILIKHTGHPIDKIEKDTDRDRFMSAEEAAEYRLVDKVIEHMQVLPQAAKSSE